MNAKKVLVALDSSTGAVPLVKIAAELANKMDAELQVLYLEDVEWTQYSFSEQISSYTGELIPFSEQHIAIQSKAIRRLIQTTFTNIGRVMNIRYSYQSVRGSVKDEFLEAASKVDVVIVNRSGHPIRQQYRIGHTALELAKKSPVPVLIWNSGEHWPKIFIGICSIPNKSQKVIEWTTYLAEKFGVPAKLFWPAEINLALEEFRQSLPASISFDRIKSISESHQHLTTEDMRYLKRSLLVISRQDIEQNQQEYLESILSSVLLV